MAGTIQPSIPWAAGGWVVIITCAASLSAHCLAAADSGGGVSALRLRGAGWWSNTVVAKADQPEEVEHEPVALPSLDSFNVSDELSVLRVKLALAQAEITQLKATLHDIACPQGLYFKEGVQLDVPESMLRGWTCYYHAPYYNATTTDDILGPELGEFVLVGAKRRGSSSLAVAAMGRRSLVFEQTQDERSTTLDNGVFWYRYWNSFGFADADDVWLNDCDVNDLQTGHRRLSWFVDQGWGGYRAGAHVDLYNEGPWEKVLYYA